MFCKKWRRGSNDHSGSRTAPIPPPCEQEDLLVGEEQMQTPSAGSICRWTNTMGATLSSYIWEETDEPPSLWPIDDNFSRMRV